MIQFAAGEITRALEERGEDIRVFLGAFDWFPGGGAKKPAAIAEAFTITRPGDTIVIAGHDEAGAMYGGLEVAEQIALGGVQSVVEKESKPFLAFRQFKYNIPSVRDQEWFHSEDYWRSFFGLLARSRFNSVGFWHNCIFAELINSATFPEAAALAPAQTERNIKTWRMILRLAKEYGVSTYLINWNIHLPEPFAEAYQLKPQGEDAPIVRDYMRHCVAETLRTYPDLTGLGLCAGEAMPSDDYDWREQWIKDTFIAGIRGSGRVVPLLHRHWWASPDSIKRLITADYPGPLLVSVKFNGEQMYTDTRPHFLDPGWIDFPDYRQWLDRKAKGEAKGVVSHLEWIPKEPYPYKIVWHLRNDTIHTYRWGDPDFVKGVVWTKRDHSIATGVDPKELAGQAVLNDSLVGYDAAWTCLTDPPGGLCIRSHGKGTIVFCQLDVLGREREKAAQQLVRNILRFAAGEKKEPRVILLDASGHSTARMLDRIGMRYQWVDELPVAK
jgi:hypothetical protein